jgi:hypothetical protein
LKDKIQLPRVQRRKPTTTSTKASSTLESTEDITQQDPNCNQKVAESYCHPLDNQLTEYLFDDSLDDEFLNSTGVPLDHLGVCKAVIKYKRCMDGNFYIRCQRTFQQLFVKLDKMTTMCLSAPKLKNSRAILSGSATTKSNHTRVVSIAYLVVLTFFKHFMHF